MRRWEKKEWIVISDEGGRKIVNCLSLRDFLKKSEKPIPLELEFGLVVFVITRKTNRSPEWREIMNVLTVSLGILCITFSVLYLLRSYRPLNIGFLAKELGHERFKKLKGTWRSPFLTLHPNSILKSQKYEVWYFKTENFDGCTKESLIVSRLFFAPLHVFYDNGQVAKVTGGAVKFEIWGNEAKAMKNLEKLLSVVREKHRETSTNPLLN